MSGVFLFFVFFISLSTTISICNLEEIEIFASVDNYRSTDKEDVTKLCVQTWCFNKSGHMIT